MKIGVRVRAARQQRGWSQDRLAREAGITRNTVQNIESGKGASFDTIDAIAAALGSWGWLDPKVVRLPDPVDSRAGHDELGLGDTPPFLLGFPSSLSSVPRLAVA